MASWLIFSIFIANTENVILHSFADICFVCITSMNLFDLSSFSSLSEVNKGPDHKLNLNIEYLCQESLL